MAKSVEKQINYLLRLTDHIGVVEHCILDKPDYVEGYCVDDNARALQVCLRFKNQYPILESVLPIYFSFIKLAAKKNGLYNDLNQDYTWQEKSDTDGEHYGRTLAALGETIKFKVGLNPKTTHLFDQIYEPFTKKDFYHNRVSAQIILGLKHYKTENIKFWADLLVDRYSAEKNRSWKWFESIISYDTGRIPLALLTAFEITNNNQYLKIALESLDFLTKINFNKKFDCFVFPGNKGWFTKSGLKNIFDQQPIEAGSATEVYSLAFQITRDKKYRDLALKSFAWYSGKNILKANMIDSDTGGVYDGFDHQEINHNQGAESILSYLLAYSAIELINL